MESQTSLYWFEKLFSASVSATLRLQGLNVTETTGYETPELKMPVLKVENLTPIGIGRACTGYRSILALFALIFSVPGVRIEKKIKGFVRFFPAMIIINYLRIYTTIILGVFLGEQAFNVIHTILWREGLIIAVLGLWLYWLKTRKVSDIKQ